MGSWELVCHGTETHGGETYDAAFCKVGTDAQAGLFCTVGGNQLNVYNAQPTKSTLLVQRFVDENAEEEYFCCSWLVDTATGELLVAAAGLKACVKVVSATKGTLYRHLVGHGNAINDLATHPTDADLLFSASKDESVRMWNVRNGKILAVFGGDRGHRDEVLSVCVHSLGNCLLSSGMDHSIKIWALDNEEVARAVEGKNSDNNPSLTAFQEGPVFSTYRVHSDYVDCARWVGDLILSKSTGNEAVLWKPCPQRRKDAASVLQRYPLPNTDIWYLRLDVDSTVEQFACGNTKGRIFLYDLDSGAMRQELKFRSSKNPVRKLAFNAASTTMVAVCSDASIWRWDLRQPNEQQSPRPPPQQLLQPAGARAEAPHKKKLKKTATAAT